MLALYIAGAIAAATLFIIDTTRRYRATGRIPPWWFLFASPWTLMSRAFHENYPIYRYSRWERRIVKIIVRAALLVFILSILWVPVTILIFTLLKAEDDYSGFVIFPALIGFLASSFVLMMRWWLFLSGMMPGDSEK